MSVYRDILEFYAACPALSLIKDLQFFMSHPRGYVFSRPDLFMMGCSVGGYEPQNSGWFIYLAVGKGKFREMVELMPYSLPWIGWAREARGRSAVAWHPTNRVLLLVATHNKKYENTIIMPTHCEQDREGILATAAEEFRGLQRWWGHAGSPETPSSTNAG